MHGVNEYVSSRFLENEPSEICSHLSEKEPKDRFFGPDKLQNHTKKSQKKNSMIVAFLVFLPFNVVLFFTNFDSVCFRFDLTLLTFRLLNFVIDIPSYLSDKEIVERSGLLNLNICLMMVMK